jgi:hypothetical protein
MNSSNTVLDTQGVGPGSKSSRQISRILAATVGLSGLQCSISHTPTAKGRVRSVVRFDASKVDTNSVSHSGAAYLVVDQESGVTQEGLDSSIAALCALLRFVVTPVSSTTFKPSATLAEFMNGEA